MQEKALQDFFEFTDIKKRYTKVYRFESGWGAGIRTPEVTESESVALPLGDTPVSLYLL